MNPHIVIPHLHLRRPTLAEVKTVARFVGYGAAVPAVLLAEGAGLLWPALLFVAAGAGAHVGRLRGGAAERARHIRAMEGLQEVAHQLQMQNARYADEQAFWWDADRQDREERHINSRTRPGVDLSNTSQEIN